MVSGAIYLTETETVRHAFQVLAERFTDEELNKTTLVSVLFKFKLIYLTLISDHPS